MVIFRKQLEQKQMHSVMQFRLFLRPRNKIIMKNYILTQVDLLMYAVF